MENKEMHKLLKSTFKKIRLATVGVLASGLFFSLFIAPVQAAVDGTMSLTASSATVTGNTTFTVRVNANTGSTAGVTVVLSRVVFDPAKLEFVSVNFNGAETMTPTGSDEGPSSSYYQFSRFTTTSMSASHAFIVGTITFKALVSSGSSALTISQADSHMMASSTDALNSVSGTSVSFTAPAVITPTVTPPAGSSSGGSTKTTTPAKTTAPAATTTTTTTPVAEPTTSAAPTVTTPQGDPIPAAQVTAKSSSKTYEIGGVVFLVLLAGIAALLTVRRRNTIGFASHTGNTVVGQTITDAMQENTNMDKIPSVETKAPGEVIEPQANDPTQNPRV